MDKNHRAILDVIAYSEGTIRYGDNNGYDVIVGGNVFDNGYKDHPRMLVNLPKLGIKSSAAGRYQFLMRIWDTLRTRLKLKDFSPANQDKAALELLRECGALRLLDQGKFDEAIHSARKIWASLPGAGYGQREESIAALRQKYRDSGGRIA